MTGKKREIPIDVKSALQTLYGDGVRNLTVDGYQKALKRLRGTDSAGARRVQRILGKHLPSQIFPRRQRPWRDTSEGLRARLALLPGNPHLIADIREVREALRLPPDQISADDGGHLWSLVNLQEDPTFTRGEVELHVASRWLYIHKNAASGILAGGPDEDALPQQLHESAVSTSNVDFTDSGSIWLKRPPEGPAPYDGLHSPIDWAVGRILERHRLPWRIAWQLTYYILTQDPYWVTDLESCNIRVSDYVGTADPGAFSVTVEGIDEFITKKDWDRVWADYVRPRQKDLWDLRGMNPQGRRGIDPEGLKAILPVYKVSVEEMLSVHQVVGRASEFIELDWDQETVRAMLEEIRELLTPAD